MHLMFALPLFLASVHTVYLDSLDLAVARQGWGEPHAGKSVENHPLTLNGHIFEHGFGTHSVGRLWVDLGKGASRFQGAVGIDDEVGHRGSVEFKVLGSDHAVIWQSRVLHGGDEPESFDIDLTARDRICLVVTDAGDGYDYDHADWADARFLVSGRAPRAFLPPEKTVTIAAFRAPKIPNRTQLAKTAETPPMGWNSYDAYGDSVTEAEVRANAVALHGKLQPFGWNTVVIDYRWYDPGAPNNDPGSRAEAELSMDAFGRLLPAPNRFPSAAGGKGFKPLADWLHGQGMTFGIHIMRGIPRLAVQRNLPIDGANYTAAEAADTNDKCPWCPDMFGVKGGAPAGQAYYDSIFRLYADWGVDFVKMDDTSQPYHTAEIEAVRRAIDRCGRQMVLSLSPGETPIADAVHVAAHANMWRVSGDFWDDWGALLHEFDLGERWVGYSSPGAWPDADMLPLGRLSVGDRSVGKDRRTRFSRNEQVTLLTLWCLLRSPLMVDANLPDLDEWTVRLLTNPNLLGLDQTWDGARARRVQHDANQETWLRRSGDGSWVLALFNLDDEEDKLSATWSSLGLKGSYTAKNLWTGRSLGRLRGTVSASLPGHAPLLIRLTRTGQG